MALVSSSQVVTDQSAVPAVKVNALKKGGVIRTAQGYLASTSFVGATTGQWYTFVRIPARARVLEVRVTNPTSSTGAVDIGLYRPDGAVIDADCFAAAFVMGAANIGKKADTVTVYTTPLRQSSLATAFSTAIDAAGATSDAEFDIAATVVTVIGTAVNTLMEVDYVLPE